VHQLLLTYDDAQSIRQSPQSHEGDVHQYDAQSGVPAGPLPPMSGVYLNGLRWRASTTRRANGSNWITARPTARRCLHRITASRAISQATTLLSEYAQRTQPAGQAWLSADQHLLPDGSWRGGRSLRQPGSIR
jgi:hypothetical protein